jgi:arginase
MRLFFPQWQGAGQAPELYAGAVRLRRLLPESVEWSEIDTPPLEPLETENGIVGRAAVIRNLIRARQVLLDHSPEQIFMIGGDCGTEIAPVSYLNRRCAGQLAVIWLDAHGDLNTPESSPSGTFHGMPLRHLLGEGDPEVLRLTFSTLRPEQVFLAGVRELDPPERAFVTDAAIRLFPPPALKAPGALVDAVQQAGFRRAYVHVDLDVLDPGHMPGVKVPAAGGIAVDDLLGVLEAVFQRLRVAGGGMVEYVPGRNDDDIALRRILKFWA